MLRVARFELIHTQTLVAILVPTCELFLNVGYFGLAEEFGKFLLTKFAVMVCVKRREDRLSGRRWFRCIGRRLGLWLWLLLRLRLGIILRLLRVCQHPCRDQSAEGDHACQMLHFGCSFSIW